MCLCFDVISNPLMYLFYFVLFWEYKLRREKNLTVVEINLFNTKSLSLCGPLLRCFPWPDAVLRLLSLALLGIAHGFLIPAPRSASL